MKMEKNVTSTKEVRMLNRDFTKTNKEYFKSNKTILISILVFLLIGILMFAIFRMNGNFEVSGYNEFTVTVNEAKADDFVVCQRDIGDIINSYGGEFDTMTIYGEGDDTQFVVRYMDKLSASDQDEVNALVAEKLGVDIENISGHKKISSIVTNKDYVYTTLSILLIVVIATIFAYARYNGASAMAMIIACLLGTLSFMSIGSIFRLSVGMSYFAMLVILNMLIAYCAINLFETMHKSSWLTSGDYSTAIKTAVSSSKYRMTAICFGVLFIGLAFVLIAPSALKYVALNIMFMAVVLLAIGLYVIPFAWSVFITRSRRREYKIKVDKETSK